MTIYLPEEHTLFKKAFDDAYDRIIACKQDPAFYHLCVVLTEQMRANALISPYLCELESKSEEQKKEFNCAALDALEDSWSRLWKYHRHKLKHRKELVRIKRIITTPYEHSYSPLYNRILFNIWEFRYHSPFCSFISIAPRLFQLAQSELPFASVRLDPFFPSKEGYFNQRKTLLCKLNKKDKRYHIHKKVFSLRQEKHAMPFRRSVECVNSALISPKIGVIEKKFSIPGQNNDEKQQNMLILAKTSFVFCWERIRFLNQCYNTNGAFPPLKPSKGRWTLMRETAWKSALERCEIEVFLGAKMALRHKLSSKPSSSMDSFLMREHRFYRGDYERYLCSLKNHIHTLLLKIENTQKKAENNPQAFLPGTLKKNFVKKLASEYWKAHPSAKQDEVFTHYFDNCPKFYRLSRYRWEQIVRKDHVDPRSKTEKVRGPGKKTSQN